MISPNQVESQQAQTRSAIGSGRKAVASSWRTVGTGSTKRAKGMSDMLPRTGPRPSRPSGFASAPDFNPAGQLRACLPHLRQRKAARPKGSAGCVWRVPNPVAGQDRVARRAGRVRGSGLVSRDAPRTTGTGGAPARAWTAVPGSAPSLRMRVKLASACSLKAVAPGRRAPANPALWRSVVRSPTASPGAETDLTNGQIHQAAGIGVQAAWSRRGLVTNPIRGTGHGTHANGMPDEGSVRGCWRARASVLAASAVP